MGLRSSEQGGKGDETSLCGADQPVDGAAAFARAEVIHDDDVAGGCSVGTGNCST